MKVVYILFSLSCLPSLYNCKCTYKRISKSDNDNSKSAEKSQYCENFKSVISPRHHKRKTDDSFKVVGNVDKNRLVRTNRIKLQENQNLKRESDKINDKNWMDLLTLNYPIENNFSEFTSTLRDNDNLIENYQSKFKSNASLESTTQLNKSHWFDHINRHMKRMSHLNGLKSLYKSIVVRSRLKNPSLDYKSDMYNKFAKDNLDEIDNLGGDVSETTVPHKLKEYLDSFEDVSFKPIVELTNETDIEHIILNTTSSTKCSIMKTLFDLTKRHELPKLIMKQDNKSESKYLDSKTLTGIQFENSTSNPRSKIFTYLILGSTFSNITSNAIYNSTITITTVRNKEQLNITSQSTTDVSNIGGYTTDKELRDDSFNKKYSNTIITMTKTTRSDVENVRRIQTSHNPNLNDYDTKELKNQLTSSKLMGPFYLVPAKQYNILLSQLKKCSYQETFNTQTVDPNQYTFTEYSNTTVQRPKKKSSITVIQISNTTLDTIDLCNNGLSTVTVNNMHGKNVSEIKQNTTKARPFSKYKYLVVYPLGIANPNKSHIFQNFSISRNNQLIYS